MSEENKQDEQKYTQLDPIFTDFAEATEYYYNEIGKLQQIDVDRKTERRLRRIILNRMFSALGLIDKKEDFRINEESRGLKDTANKLKENRAVQRQRKKQEKQDAVQDVRPRRALLGFFKHLTFRHKPKVEVIDTPQSQDLLTSQVENKDISADETDCSSE